MNFWPAKSALQLSARAALSAGIAVAIAEFFRLEFPIYALVGAVIVTDLSAATTRQLARARLTGSIVGAVVGAVISQYLPQAAWAIALSILLAMFLSSVLHLRERPRSRDMSVASSCSAIRPSRGRMRSID
jgi:uncharacterized membrane protein YgaE (UPF0421/DUF939 family)